MKQPDGALAGGHLDGQGQAAVVDGERRLLGRGQVLKPAAAVSDPVLPIAALVTADVVVVIAADRVKPGSGQPVDHLAALGPAIRQIPDAEETVPGGIKIQGVEGLLQQGEVAVDVADGQIAPLGVLGEASYQGGGCHGVSCLYPGRGCFVCLYIRLQKKSGERAGPGKS